MKELADFAIGSFLNEKEKAELDKLTKNIQAQQNQKETLMTKQVTDQKQEVKEEEAGEEKKEKQEKELTKKIEIDDIPDEILEEEKSDDNKEEEEDIEEKEKETQIEQKDSEPQEKIPADKQGKAFAAMRNEIKALQTKLAEYENKYSKEKEEYKKTIEELTNKLSRYSLEENPNFQREYVAPIKQIQSQVEKLLKEFEIQNPEAVANSLLNASVKKRAEFLRENLPDIGQTILNLTMQYDALMEKKNSALLAHKELQKKFEEEENNKRAMQEIKMRQELFATGLNELVEEGQFILQPIEGNENWNRVLEATKQRMKFLFETNDIKEQAKALILGATAPVYLKMYLIEREKRKALEKKIGNAVKSNKTGKQVSSQSETQKKLDSLDVIREVMNKYQKSS